MVHPTRGDRRPVFGYEDVRDASAAQERAERLRLYYVAMTRAVDRLIVSGAVDPERTGDRETPIGWVIERLEAGEEIAAAGREPVELERGGARWIVRVDRYAAEVTAPIALATPGPERQLSLFDEVPAAGAAPGPPLPDLEPFPVPPAHAPRRLSYSAIALVDTCAYRYYAERVLGLRPRAGGAGALGTDGLAATEIGDAAHRLLELVPLHDPVPPGPAELAETVRGWYPAVTEEELGRIAGFVDAYCRSALALRIAGLSKVAAEQPFAFEHDAVLFHGRLDAFSLTDGHAVVLDYKTNQIDERDPAEVVAGEYALQRTVYALAALKAGAAEVEVVYVFLERPDEPVSATFGQSDMRVLEEELSAAIARIRDGDFRPTPSDFACSGCPALDLVCAGPRLRGGPTAAPLPELTAAG
jgi:RecB family exonuclease